MEKTVYLIIFFHDNGMHHVMGIAQDIMSLCRLMDKFLPSLQEDDLTALCNDLVHTGVATWHVGNGDYRIYEKQCDIQLNLVF